MVKDELGMVGLSYFWLSWVELGGCGKLSWVWFSLIEFSSIELNRVELSLFGQARFG